MSTDEKYVRRAIELADISVKNEDWPFGAVLAQGDTLIAEGTNTARSELTGHAEVNAIKKAWEGKPDLDFSQCTLYSNFEPCPMCSFIIREYGIGRVVYSLPSPYWGGSSRWKILKDHIPPEAFAQVRNPNPPEVIGGVLAKKAKEAFEGRGWKMHLPPTS